MATLELFDSLLKEVVTAKRLSASKMNKLTDVAMSLMENDTQLVSTLYRTHKTLAPSSKIHSLYAFDALARAARSKATKLGQTGDINAEKGNFATFLLKVDGVLDGLIQDMVSIPSPEAKEKTRKILDIWTKNSTFPPNVLARLAEFAKDSPQKDTVDVVASGPPTDPRAAAHASLQAVPPQPASLSPITGDPVHAQAILQALLGSTLSSTGDPNHQNGSIPNQIGTNPAGGLDQSQLLLLQQLVEKTKSGNNNGVTPPNTFPQTALTSQVATPPQPIASGSVITPSAPQNNTPQGIYTSESRGSTNLHEEQRHGRWEGPKNESFREHDDLHDRERQGWRGGFRGGRGGPPNRGGRQGWRDHDTREGPPRRRRSRSRSPPRYGRGGARSGRDIRPYSPPRRPSLAPIIAKDEAEKASRPPPPGALQEGKDEFGRDIRSGSPDAPAAPTLKTPSSEPNAQPQSQSQSQSSHHPNTQSSNTDSSYNSASSHSISLDQFDFSTFDFSSPTAWEALAKAWQASHGSLPSQEQLMQLVMGIMSQSSAGNPADQEGAGGSSWGSAGKQSLQPGKSIPTYESGSNLSSNSWQGKNAAWQRNTTSFDYEHGTAPVDDDTDAVVLGGGEMPTSGGQGEFRDPQNKSETGGMKRIGDRWVWQPS